ncbi:hypothetical protein JCM11251_003177 [Rhodosporidiobolus azoricus]
MPPSTASSTMVSEVTERENDAADGFVGRGQAGEPGPALQKVEKDVERKVEEGRAVSPGKEALRDDVRDSDGVLLENGVPIVRLTGPDDPDSPLNLPTARKWLIVIVITSAAFCITCCSSMIAFTYPGVESEFHVSQEVATLGLSLYVLGMGLFPLLVGPLSEWYGRSPVYFIGFGLFLVFQFMCAFSNNIATLILGRFFAGSCGSAFLSVAGGTVADMFRPAEVGAPMQTFTAGPFLGPVFGPILSGFINQHLDWRWTWYVLAMWAGVELVLLLVFVPETYLQAVLKHKAKRLRKSGRTDVRAPVEVDTRSIPSVIATSCVKPFQLLALEPMAFMLCVWSALLLGIMYMSFTAWGIVYGQGYGFETQIVGLTYIPLGIGITVGACTHPIWAA